MPRAKTDDARRLKTLNAIVAFTKALPDVVESTSYGRPALKRGDKLIFSQRDPESLSLSCSFEDRVTLLRDHPATFYVTDHYLNWPAVIVRLLDADMKALRLAVQAAWERAGAKARKKRPAPAATRKPRAR
jgi:hypothetical protein